MSSSFNTSFVGAVYWQTAQGTMGRTSAALAAVVVAAAAQTVHGDDAAAALAEAGGDDRGCFIKGFAYANGGDADHPEYLTAVTGTFTLATCQAKCSSTDGCVFFNFDVKEQSCMLGSAGSKEGELGVSNTVIQ